MTRPKWMLGGLLLACAGAVAAAQDVLLVLDNSGSMRRHDPHFLTHEAVTGFLSRLPEQTWAGMLIFDQDVDLAVPLTPLSGQTRPLLLSALEEVDYSGQYTDSPAAMERALYELRTQGREGAAKSIVFMTDGIVDTGDSSADLDRSRWLREELSAEALEAGIRVFGIAFTDQADFQLIQTLARRTGGDYFRAYTAADLAGVFAAINASMAPQPQPALPAPAQDAAPASAQVEAAEPPLDLAPPAVESPEPMLGIDDPEPVLTAPLDPAAAQAPEPPAEPGQPARGEERQPPPAGAPQWAYWLAGIAGAGVLVLALVLLRRRPRPAALEAETADEAPPRVPQAFLNDLHEATAQASYELAQRPTVVGRSPAREDDGMTHVVIDETTVGRRHAIVEYKDYTYWIVDLNSVNGTYVNDKRITEQVPLKHGDRVRFHKTEFEFVMPEMFESGMTLMSHTVFAGHASEPTAGQEQEEEEGVTIQRPSSL